MTTVDPQDLAAYLHATGWRRVATADVGTHWRFDEGGSSRNVAVPSRVLDRDSQAATIWATLGVLEQIEKRPAASIAASLLDAARDVVRIRLVAPELQNGEIPVRVAPDLALGSRDALAFAARAEVRTSPVYPSGTLPSLVDSFLDHAKVGATEPGSVVLTVRADIDEAGPEGQLSFLPEADRSPKSIPFERRALRRLVEAVGAAKSAVQRGLPEAALQETAYDDEIDKGLSANLCDALMRLSGPSLEVGADIELSVRWALSIPANEPSSKVRIASNEVRALKGVAEVLRKIQPLRNRIVTGQVREVAHAPEAPTGSAEMTAEMEGRALRVKVRLAGEDIPIAKEAHLRNETHELRVRGTLEKRGRLWEIEQPKDLAVVPISSSRATD
ncbi:hypothetical protein [Patulibacter defluvii]|uniref:hypothetical protein n=1 Tax=Patulibacter defluvii TaxID=3095358 RepID=UPI002A75D0F4|nr:hypothetical protein [Patulibacter sp. DM4]